MVFILCRQYGRWTKQHNYRRHIYEQIIQTKNFFLRKRIALFELFHLQVLVCGIFMITRRLISSFADLSLTKNKWTLFGQCSRHVGWSQKNWSRISNHATQHNHKNKHHSTATISGISVKILDICLRLKLQKYIETQLTDQICGSYPEEYAVHS